jgi:hypothetical protein
MTSDCSYVSQLEKHTINDDLVPNIILDSQESVKTNTSLSNGKAIFIQRKVLPISLAFGQEKIDEMKSFSHF